MAQRSRGTYAVFQQIATEPIGLDSPPGEDAEMTDVEDTPDESGDRLVIAIDFGTTFSSVAYAKCSKGSTDPGSVEVHCITNYPDDRPPPSSSFAWQPREEVPTELWYTHGFPARGSGLATVQPVEPDPNDGDSSSVFSDSTEEGDNAPQQVTERTVPDRGISEHLLWGYGVQKEMKRADIPKDGTRRLARFKLTLEEKEQTKVVREELAPIFKKLRNLRIIKKDSDVIRDYLELLLRHTKSELQKWDDYDANLTIEFVLCLPAVWPTKGYLTMQTALSEAIQLSGLYNLKERNLDLFIVSEPEAAATCIIAEDNCQIYTNEIIIVIDAGGGTIDTVTYQIAKSYPLRLSAEMVSPGTELCGASYINEEYQVFLSNRLKDETYLERNGKTINSIVESKVIEFENGEKRIFNIRDETFEPDPISIEYLEPNDEKGFEQNRLKITRNDLKDTFKTSLKNSAKLLQDQLDLARAGGYSVSKVILTGGFGQSPSLRYYLRKKLEKQKNLLDEKITFLTAQISGAVLRALNKEDGPDRITMCSYGFLQTDPFEPQIIAAHKGVRPRRDKVDGEKYIDSTINWLIQKGTLLPHRHEFAITVRHTFKHWRTKLICSEELYQSDKNHEKHYRKRHALNKGAQLAGIIEADMTFLKNEGHIELEAPSIFCTDPDAKPFWSVEFELVMIVDGRNLRYEARWPAPGKDKRPVQNQTVHAQGQICIAAAFKPGTA